MVIPCYNAEQFIEECIESIQTQDYPNIEIIIVNDASTDHSQDLIQKMQQQDNRISLITNLINKGECYTSTVGFRMARGEYLCRLSSDDAFTSPDHISRQVGEMEKYNVDWCYNNAYTTGSTRSSAQPLETAWINPPIKNAATIFQIFDNLVLKHPYVCYLIAGRKNPVNSSTIMFRASTYRKNNLTWGNSDIRSICDGYLLARLFLLKLKARAICKRDVFYRVHPGQATGKPETNKDLKRHRDKVYLETQKPKYPLWVRAASKILARSY